MRNIEEECETFQKAEVWNQAKVNYEKAKEIVEANRKEGFNKPTYEEYHEFMQPFYEQKRSAYIALLNLVDPITTKLKPLDNAGDYFTLEEFKKCCDARYFIDNDGIGTLCIKNNLTEYNISPSLLRDSRSKLTAFDGIMWYNK